MAEKNKRRFIQQHEPGETDPCEECVTELRLLRRAQELHDEGVTEHLGTRA